MREFGTRHGVSQCRFFDRIDKINRIFTTGHFFTAPNFYTELHREFTEMHRDFWLSPGWPGPAQGKSSANDVQLPIFNISVYLCASSVLSNYFWIFRQVSGGETTD